MEWLPHITVATIVEDNGRFLMVEEHKAGRNVLNQPAGHLDPDETLIDAAIRETLEETGWEVAPTAFIGAYQWKAETGRHYLRFAFSADPDRHLPDRPLDDGIVQAVWLTPAELQAQADRHRSPLVWRVVQDYLAGRRSPLSTLQHIA